MTAWGLGAGRRPAGATASWVALLALGLAGLAATAHGAPRLRVFPVPGSHSAAPGTDVALRGVGPRRLGRVVVRGSVTGRHAGALRRHASGRGMSFVARRPFAPGERVTVTTRVRVAGARVRRVRFRIAPEPARVAPPTGPPANPLQPAPLTDDALWRFASRPDLRPPVLDVTPGEAGPTDLPGSAPLFLSTTGGGRPSGLEIADEAGVPVWYHPVANALATDFRVQRLGRRPVLTWWQGSMPILGVGRGRGIVMDDRYRVVREVRAGNGLQADLHEFRLTRRGTALLVFYHPVVADLSALGGSGRGVVLDSGVQEVDLRTGLVVFEWHCLDDVAIAESYGAVPQDPAEVFDFCHVNAIDEGAGGDLLISARNTHAVYLVDRRTGRLRWRLGGRRSTFALGADARFSWQHDARWRGRNRISLFDNASFEGRPSRGIVLRLDQARRTATLARSYTSAPERNAASQGGMQVLPGGQVLVGWGNQPFVSQFAPSGALAREWRFRYGGFNSYRAFRLPWTGRPHTRPRVVARADGSGATTVAVSWNGAGEVTRWTILAGARPAALRPVAGVPRQGFETTATIAGARFVAVVARGRDGRVLGRSRPVSVDAGAVAPG